MLKEASCLITVLYIVYFEFLVYNVLNSVGNIYWQTFFKDSCYSQQIISSVAKESLITYNLTQRAPEVQNL